MPFFCFFCINLYNICFFTYNTTKYLIFTMNFVILLLTKSMRDKILFILFPKLKNIVLYLP